MNPPSFAEISQEFNDSFGYIRQDIRAICKGSETINYTVALLVGCACEMLAAARGERQHPERILAEILEPEWKPLANRLFTAVRDGLAHGFDTKHLVIDDVKHQIYMKWNEPSPFKVVREQGKVNLYVGTRVLADLICTKIDELERLLKVDASARATWLEKAHRHQREIKLNSTQREAWRKLTEPLSQSYRPYSRGANC